MKSGQPIVPAEKNSIAAGRAGALAGILLVAALLPLPLGAAIDRREPSRTADTAPSGGRFPYVASDPDDLLNVDQLVADQSLQVSDAVVPPVKRVVPKTPDVPADDAAAPAPSSDDDAAKAGDTTPWSTHELTAVDRVQDWLARANRAFQTTVVRRLSTPPAGLSAEDEIARKLEEVKAQDAEAAKRAAAAEEAQKAADAKAAEERRQAAEAQRREDERRATEEAKAATPPPLPLAETKPEDAARLAEEMKQERARLEAEATRIETERKAAEAQRKVDEKKHLEEERAKLAAAKLEDDRRRAAAAAEKKAAAAAADAENAASAAAEKAAAEEEKKAAAEVEKQAAAEAQKKAAAEKAAADEAARQAAAEQEKKVAAEAERKAAADEAEKRAAAEAERKAADEAEKNRARTVELTKPAVGPPAAALPSPPPAPAASPSTVPPVASTAEPEADREANSDEPPARHARSDREASNSVAPSNRVAHGPVVKRWVWRARNGRCRDAGRRILLPGRYTVARGDSLWLISKRFYRTGLLYRKLYRANRAIIRDPDLIYPCQRLYVPRRH